MTTIVDDPKSFAADSLRGFVAAYPEYVTPVHGGVVRTTASPTDEVAVVVGGGSGHYPAFAGWVGPGLAHGSVCGNVFASPSASQVLSVAQASNNGAGVLLLFGNYAGDCLHFGKAADELRERGVRAECVTISDDIASNSPEKSRDRRGIAGDLAVVKAAGAAAGKGMGFDEVVRVAWKANDATRSLGVAFSGCTLPGADEPLFTVPDNEFALGLGIHGEPGLSTQRMVSASELAALLVDAVLSEEPPQNDLYQGRAAVIVNGLGATKYEELFLLFGRISELLTGRGIEIVAPVVGEQVTSLDMAGVSLSLMFLDDELEDLWCAPAGSPAFCRGQLSASGAHRVVHAEAAERAFTPGSAVSQLQAGKLITLLEEISSVTIDAEESLGKLDSIAGDGDHGQGMVLGATAALRGAREAFESGAGLRSVLRYAGQCWAEGSGGTSGAYWGAALESAAEKLSDSSEASENAIAQALIAGISSFSAPGGAVVGDKTMVDASEPSVTALREQVEAGVGLSQALLRAAEVATGAAEATANLVARRGRARTHGAASLGHPDPGAVSFALVMSGLARAYGAL